MRQLHSEVTGYKSVLGPGGSRIALCKIGWKIFKSDDVNVFWMKLTRHREAIIMLLTLSTLYIYPYRTYRSNFANFSFVVVHFSLIDTTLSKTKCDKPSIW